MKTFNSKKEFTEWYLEFFEPRYLDEVYEDYLLNLQQQSLCRLSQGDTFLDGEVEWVSLYVDHNSLLKNPFLNVDSEGYYLFSGKYCEDDPLAITSYGKILDPYCLLFLPTHS